MDKEKLFKIRDHMLLEMQVLLLYYSQA